MFINNDNSRNIKNNINIENDDYDYLDSLMQDMMETNEPESAIDGQPEPTIDNKVDHSDGHLNESEECDAINIDVNQGEQQPAEEDLTISTPDNRQEEEYVAPKRRRVPLLQQLGKDLAREEKPIQHEEKNTQPAEDYKEDLNPNPITRIDTSDLFESEQYDSQSGHGETEESKFKHDKYDNIQTLFNQESNIKSEEAKVETDNFEVTNGLPHNSDDNKYKESLFEDDNNLSNSDMFEGMLADLTGDTTDEVEISKDNFNSNKAKDSVIVPLETPEMNQIKVTADGRTLAEMLPGMRSGKKTTNQKVAEIINRNTVVKIQDKEFSDNRYVKHAEETNKKRIEQEKRKALSMKFLQKNANLSEHEKAILQNLNVTNEEFTKIMGSKELTKKDKEKILAAGKHGAEKHFKGRRYRTTVGDTAMLEFLAKFKFANTRILRWISNEPQGRTWRKLNRLRDNGLAESKSLIGVPDLWATTDAGMALSGYSFAPGLRPMPKMTTISSTMGINYIAACLWFNTINVLNLDDYPAHNRIIPLQEDGRDRVRGEMIISELEIRSSLGKEINPGSTTMKTLGDQRLYDVMASNVRTEIEEWKTKGKLGDSPEFLLGNEYMWVLYPMNELTLSYHVPDLVVQRERGPNGEPKSIAVEMERYEKNSDRYEKTLLAYKLDEHLYEKVIWITQNNRVARAIEAAAKQVGFDRYTIIPIITETGIYSKQDIWMI